MPDAPGLALLCQGPRGGRRERSSEGLSKHGGQGRTRDRSTPGRDPSRPLPWLRRYPRPGLPGSFSSLCTPRITEFTWRRTSPGFAVHLKMSVSRGAATLFPEGRGQTVPRAMMDSRSKPRETVPNDSSHVEKGRSRDRRCVARYFSRPSFQVRARGLRLLRKSLPRTHPDLRRHTAMPEVRTSWAGAPSAGLPDRGRGPSSLARTTRDPKAPRWFRAWRAAALLDEGRHSPKRALSPANEGSLRAAGRRHGPDGLRAASSRPGPSEARSSRGF